jgi:hypothetical protein
MVLGLGAVVVTAAGCVWYLPALADLRAGSDRPDSRRTAAAACVTGWAATAAGAVLLLMSEAWWPPVGAAVAGVAVAVGLRIRAAVQYRYEARETARHWAVLRPTTAPGHGSHGSTSQAFAALAGFGLFAAVVTAILLLAAGPEGGGNWLVALTAPVAVAGVFLAIAATHTSKARGRTTEGRARP